MVWGWLARLGCCCTFIARCENWSSARVFKNAKIQSEGGAMRSCHGFCPTEVFTPPTQFVVFFFPGSRRGAGQSWGVKGSFFPFGTEQVAGPNVFLLCLTAHAISCLRPPIPINFSCVSRSFHVFIFEEPFHSFHLFTVQAKSANHIFFTPKNHFATPNSKEKK